MLKLRLFSSFFRANIEFRWWIQFLWQLVDTTAKCSLFPFSFSRAEQEISFFNERQKPQWIMDKQEKFNFFFDTTTERRREWKFLKSISVRIAGDDVDGMERGRATTRWYLMDNNEKLSVDLNRNTTHDIKFREESFPVQCTIFLLIWKTTSSCSSRKWKEIRVSRKEGGIFIFTNATMGRALLRAMYREVHHFCVE